MSFDNIVHSHANGHKHDHGHDHNHGGLGHSHGANAPHKVLMLAIFLTLGFAFVAAFGGIWAKSLALLSDAGHMASDSLALAIAAFAAWISTKPPSDKHTYGLQRAEVVAAWISSLMMVGISIAVLIEAIERIRTPTQVHGLTVVFIALAGMVVNIFVAWMLARGERTLNVRAALLHVMSDILGSLAALIAGAVIYFTNWYEVDPILSILISILILWSALKLLRESLMILMEGVPGHINLNNVSTDLGMMEGIKGIHDLHIWTLSSGTVAMSAHVHIHELSSWAHILPQIKKMLQVKYSIEHVTLQPEADIIDCQPCQDPKK